MSGQNNDVLDSRVSIDAQRVLSILQELNFIWIFEQHILIF